MKKFFANPEVRLAGRAIVAGLLAALTMIHNTSDGRVAWQAVIVAAGLATVEVFTPLNSLVGVFKGGTSGTQPNAAG